MDNRPAATGNSGGGGGGGGRNKNNRSRKRRDNRGRRRGDHPRQRGGNKSSSNNNNSSSNNKNSQRNKGPPSPPQTKILVRNIGDVTKYGTVKDVITLIRSIVDGANQKLLATTSRIIQLEESSVEYLIKQEETIRKAVEEAVAAAKKKKEEEIANASAAAETAQPTTTTEEENNSSNAEEIVPEDNDNDDPDVIINKSEDQHNEDERDAPGTSTVCTEESSTVNLSAKVIYIVPPKQTRRRGIKPGCAYIVITGPHIEVKEARPPATVPMAEISVESVEEKKETAVPVQEENVEKPQDAEGGASTTKKNGDETPTSGEATKSNNGTSGATAGHHVTIVDPPSTIKDSSVAAGSAALAADYSREVTKGRFLVLQAIELLEAQTKEDAKTEQKYAGSMVEVALSGKTYKHQSRKDRREGTLEQTADYKNFIEKTARDKEERLARPKPAPGGGSSVAAPDLTENGQPVAALVEHIRSKHQEASQRKKAKKRAKDSAAKKDKNATGGKSRKKKGKDGKEEGGKKGGRKKEGKKSKRAGKKKTTRGGGAATSLGAPTLLKPAPGMMAPTHSHAPPPAPATNGAMGGFQGYG